VLPVSEPSAGGRSIWLSAAGFAYHTTPDDPS